MNKLLYSLLISSLTYGAIDTGTGADGACNWSGTVPSQTYNCTDLTISGATTFSGNNPVVVKVQGDVFINFSITLNGQTGSAGGIAIAGGYDGGAPSTNGSGPLANTQGTKGEGGIFNTDIDAGGGGGSGGSSATLGSNGITGSGSDGGAGGSAPTAISNISSSLSTSINGGAGGGGGGSDPLANLGGRGGAGAGIFKISAGGNISINAAITLNGGAGENGSSDSGGGGGGAGGALYFETEGDITHNSSISAIGGAGGNGSGNGGNGGAGGDGIIRLDDFDGSVAGSGTSTPSAISLKTGVAGTSTQTSYTSDISPGCAVRDVSDKNSIFYLYSFLVLLTLIFLHKIKFLKEI